MKKVSPVVLGVVSAVVLMGGLAFAQQDAKGCKDHPLFTRMPNFCISGCETKEYNEYGFYEPPQGQKKVTVGGKYYSIEYSLQKGIEPKASDIQVMRNYVNAARQIGASVYE